MAAPVANAGSSAETCGSEPVQLSGTATAFSAVLWTTAGDGRFSNPDTGAAIYTPGSADVLAGSVNLTFTASGNLPCAASSVVIVIAIVSPASVEAGEDMTICAGQNSQLPAVAADFTSVQWASSGDGQFDDASLLTPTYEPGPEDISSGQALLTVTALGNGPCAEIADQLMLVIQPLPFAFAGNDTTI